MLVYSISSQQKKWMWFQWAELIQVRKEQCLLKCSKCTTVHIHRTNFPMSWDQCWLMAPLLWCDHRENHFSCHSVKNYWFRHCTVGLQGIVKLRWHLSSPRSSCALWGCLRCRLPAGVALRSALHTTPSIAAPLLPCTAHLPLLSTLLILQSRHVATFFAYLLPLGTEN